MTDRPLTRDKPTAFPNGIQALLVNASTGQPVAAITPITDNSGGVASNTQAAIVAGAAYAQADMVAAKNGLASADAKINAIISALQSAGVTL